MATDGRDAATRGVQIDAMLEARMKTETQGPADSESRKDAGKASCIIRSERLKESWEEATPKNVKRESEAGLLDRWEAQWQQFLKTVRSPQSRQGDAPLPGLAPRSDSPGEGTSNTRPLSPGEETELLSGINGETQHPVNNLLVKDQVDCWKVKEETPAEGDARWDLERPCASASSATRRPRGRGRFAECFVSSAVGGCSLKGTRKSRS
ncbi:uncharacterized protein LOC125428850 [Sphaerodactylus townsendi]|uniref:uncharacterized protein LOC125428850 n=1 Tax=Sphaerodactylus townsendi TaxID=933632 RepID=UPI002025F692|nr:uncharacterized protein LOC125428850 [Sphaerodactylus townsendi]